VGASRAPAADGQPEACIASSCPPAPCAGSNGSSDHRCPADRPKCPDQPHHCRGRVCGGSSRWARWGGLASRGTRQQNWLNSSCWLQLPRRAANSPCPISGRHSGCLPSLPCRRTVNSRRCLPASLRHRAAVPQGDQRQVAVPYCDAPRRATSKRQEAVKQALQAGGSQHGWLP
jgi:hypothetical protein